MATAPHGRVCGVAVCSPIAVGQAREAVNTIFPGSRGSENRQPSSSVKNPGAVGGGPGILNWSATINHSVDRLTQPEVAMVTFAQLRDSEPGTWLEAANDWAQL